MAFPPSTDDSSLDWTGLVVYKSPMAMRMLDAKAKIRSTSASSAASDRKVDLHCVSEPDKVVAFRPFPKDPLRMAAKRARSKVKIELKPSSVSNLLRFSKVREGVGVDEVMAAPVVADNEDALLVLAKPAVSYHI